MSRADKNQRNGVSRRTVLKGVAAAGGLAAGSSVGGFPTIWAQNIKDVVLHHAGPPVTAIPRIAEQASKDLGFTVQMQAIENADLLNRFLSQSSAIDCADVSLVFMRYLIGRNVLQTIPLAKVKYWDKTIPLFTKGEYPDGRKASQQGITPTMILYATGADGQKVTPATPTEWVTGVPTVTNADTLGIRPDLVGPADHRAGPTCSAPSSRARRRCRTSRRSASSTSRWRWRRAATSSTATRAT